MTNRIKWMTLLAALSSFLLVGRTAVADGAGETVVRQQLIKSAEMAHQGGHHDVALDYAKKAAGIATSATLYLFIAQEQEELGQILESYASAQECIHAAEFDPKTRLRDKAVANCVAVVGRLAPRIGQIVVELPAPPPGSTLKINGKPTSVQIAGTPYPVTVGAVTIEATAPGYQPFKTDVTVAPAETRHVSVALQMMPCPDHAQRLTDGSCPAPITVAAPAQVTAPPAVVAATPRGTSSPPSGRASLRRWSYVAAGTGAALLIGGAIAWEVAGSKFSSTQDACALGCTAQTRSSGVSSIQTWDTLSDVGFIAGGVLVATGAVLFLLSPPTENSAPSRVSFGIDPAHGSLLLGGSF